MTKKVDGRDLRTEPDEEPVADASRFRIDRVFVPPVKREASGPTAMRPARGRPPSRPAIAIGDPEVVELRRQLSRLQRQLADMSDQLADKEDQLAREVAARLTQAAAHDTLHGQVTQLEYRAMASETRARELADRLAGEVAQMQQLGRERDDLLRAREEGTRPPASDTHADGDTSHAHAELAALTAAHETLLRERATQDAELGAYAERAAEHAAVARAHAEAEQRIATLESTLSETHARWNAERKEVEAAHEEEQAELETTLRVSTDAAAAELQRLREVVRNDGASSGLAVAAAKAENERELMMLRKEYEAAAAKLREEHAAALAVAEAAAVTVRDDHAATSALLRAAIEEAQRAATARLAAQADEHAAALASVRAEAESAKGGLEGELAKQRMAAAKVRAENEAALASARAEHLVAQTALSAQVDQLGADHEQELATARHQHVSAQAEATAELARVSAEHDAAVIRLRGEAEQAVRAAEDRAATALSDAVIQTAADQVALSRGHRQELDRLEEARAGLERGLEQAQREAAAREQTWEQTIRGHDATIDELADATSLGARFAEESGVRGERIDELTRTLEGMQTELAALQERLEASDVATRTMRDGMAAHLRQGLALLGDATGTPAGTDPSPDLQVRFRSSPDD